MSRKQVVSAAEIRVGIGIWIVIGLVAVSCNSAKHSERSARLSDPDGIYGGLLYGDGDDDDDGPDAGIPGPDAGQADDGGYPYDGGAPGDGGPPDDGGYPGDGGTPGDGGAPGDGGGDDDDDGGDCSDGPMDGPPKDRNGDVIPGYKGKKEIPTPATGQWWWDTDGVDPAVAGCHYAHTTENNCIMEKNRVGAFGEYCEMDTGWLVESNPEARVCHEHGNAKGKPYRYDCDEYCKGKNFASGTCVTVENACEDAAGVKNQPSARCACRS